MLEGACQLSDACSDAGEYTRTDYCIQQQAVRQRLKSPLRRNGKRVGGERQGTTVLMTVIWRTYKLKVYEAPCTDASTKVLFPEEALTPWASVPDRLRPYQALRQLLREFGASEGS